MLFLLPTKQTCLLSLTLNTVINPHWLLKTLHTHTQNHPHKESGWTPPAASEQIYVQWITGAQLQFQLQNQEVELLFAQQPFIILWPWESSTPLHCLQRPADSSLHSSNIWHVTDCLLWRNLNLIPDRYTHKFKTWSPSCHLSVGLQGNKYDHLLSLPPLKLHLEPLHPALLHIFSTPSFFAYSLYVMNAKINQSDNNLWLERVHVQASMCEVLDFCGALMNFLLIFFVMCKEKTGKWKCKILDFQGRKWLETDECNSD